MARQALMGDPNLQIGIAAHQRGDMQTASAYYSAALNSNPQNYYATYNMACISARAGNTDQAFQLLGMAIEAGFDGAKHMKQDPELRELRGDPLPGDRQKAPRRKSLLTKPKTLRVIHEQLHCGPAPVTEEKNRAGEWIRPELRAAEPR